MRLKAYTFGGNVIYGMCYNWLVLVTIVEIVDFLSHNFIIY